MDLTTGTAVTSLYGCGGGRLAVILPSITIHSDWCRAAAEVYKCMSVGI